MKTDDKSLLDHFESGDIAATAFGHREHLQVAYSMLGRYDFVEACARYASTIRAMATSAGAPEKYNTTITIAFMSLIAERLSRSTCADFDAFLASNPDLLNSDVLNTWYSQERLQSPLARCQFLLPDKAA